MSELLRFIIVGVVPGTDYQLGFWSSIVVMAAVSIIAYVGITRFRRSFKAYADNYLESITL